VRALKFLTMIEKLNLFQFFFLSRYTLFFDGSPQAFVS
jgi:hypothetical protein